MCYHVYDNASGRYGMLSDTEGSLRSWACLLVLVIMKFCKERNDLKWPPLCSWHNTVYVLKEFPRALEVGVQMKCAGGEVISLEHWWPGGTTFGGREATARGLKWPFLSCSSQWVQWIVPVPEFELIWCFKFLYHMVSVLGIFF